MNKILFFSIISAVAGLHASEQVIAVAPQSLAGWSVLGAEAGAVAEGQSLVLPAGGQLVRAFQGAHVAVTLVSRPVFGLDSADWPVLEIGSAALIFQRQGDQGRLALALDGHAPLTLPFVIKLDPESRSAEPVTVDFIRRGGVVMVMLAGNILPFAVEEPTAPQVEVVVSTGAKQAWVLEKMTVVVTTPDVEAETDRETSGKESSNDRPKIASAGAASNGGGAGSVPNAVGGSAADVSPTASQAGSAVASGSPNVLEVFTPASVRHGRADAIRATPRKDLQP